MVQLDWLFLRIFVKINRILIIGSGAIALRHLNAAKHYYPRASYGFLTPHSKKKSNCNEIKNYYSITAALSFNPQITVVANPASLHINTAIPFAEKGSHLLIEKPLSINEKGILDLLNIIKNKKTVLAVGYNLRYTKSLRKFREFIENKKIGNVLMANIEAGQYLPTWRSINYKKSVSAQSKLGGGVLLELSHEIDYMQWIFGKPEWVLAKLSKQSNLEIDVEDTVKAIFSIKSKILNSSILVSVSLDFIRRDKIRQCLAIGSKGTLRWNGLLGTIEIYKENTSDWRLIFQDQSDSYLNEWKDFSKAIRNKSNSLVTGIEGLNVMKIVDFVRLSSNKNKKIFFKDL